MKTIKIEVTETDIKKGQIGSTSLCPIALALKRATKTKIVFVGTRHLSYRKGLIFNRYYQSDLPDDATDFINSFDFEKPVEPFSFEIIV